jgi:tetratricopeptide (TPR) repeat protein
MPTDQENTTAENAESLNGALQFALAVLGDARKAAAENAATSAQLVKALQNVAGNYSDLGEFENAEASFKEAIELGEKVSVPDEKMASLRAGLAALYDFNGHEESAVPIYEAAITSYQSLTPPQPLEAARLHNNLAMIYKSLQRNPLAEQHYLAALEIFEKAYGRNVDQVATLYNNLGSLYYTAGFAEQSKEMHLEALEIRTEIYGPLHRDVAQSYCNLAASCYELNDPAGVAENFDLSLDIYEKLLPEEKESYQDIVTDYLAVLESFGNETKASSVKERAGKFIEL